MTQSLKTKFVVKLNRSGIEVYVSRADRSPIETTSKRKLALVMGKLTAEDVVKNISISRRPELVAVQRA